MISNNFLVNLLSTLINFLDHNYSYNVYNINFFFSFLYFYSTLFNMTKPVG